MLPSLVSLGVIRTCSVPALFVAVAVSPLCSSFGTWSEQADWMSYALRSHFTSTGIEAM